MSFPFFPDDHPWAWQPSPQYYALAAAFPDPFPDLQFPALLLDPRPDPTPEPSPQFVFEFPGGAPDDDAIPPLALAAPPAPDPDPARPASPATEEMKSMMSVFRVDPFASYDAAPDPAARHRRRRKRPSAYARLADPAASAREPPLLFTFQLHLCGLSDALPPDAADDFTPPPAPPPPPPDFSTAYAAAPPAPFDPAALLAAAFPAPPSPPAPAAAPPSPRGARPKTHACWVCHKDFPRPSGLATHMHTHSGAKPFRCPVPACAKPFAVRSNARRHLRTHSARDLASARAASAPDDDDDVKCEAYGACPAYPCAGDPDAAHFAGGAAAAHFAGAAPPFAGSSPGPLVVGAC